MKSTIKYYGLVLLSILIVACGGSGTGNNSISYGNMSFSNTNIELAANGSTVDILMLTGSANVSNTSVTLTIADPAIATLNSESCTISSSLDSCPITIKAKTPGNTTITATSSYNGHIYSIAPVNITVATNSNTGIKMSESGVSQTIYAAQTYNGIFTFTNNTASTINIESITINGASNLGTTINAAGCSNTQLSTNGSCSITADGINMAINTLAPLNFVLHTTNGDIYSFDMPIVAVRNYSAPNSDPGCSSGCAAFRITNQNNTNHTLYIVAVGKNSAGNQYLVKFTKNSNGDYIGALAPTSETYPQASLVVPATGKGITLYQPNYSGLAGGIGGLMYVSLDKPLPIDSSVSGSSYPGAVGPAPWTGNESLGYGMTFSAYEPNVWTNPVAPGQLLSLLDITDINFVGFTQGFYGADINTNATNKKSGLLASEYESLTSAQVYTLIQSNLNSNWSGSWGINGFFYQNPDWVMIFGAANWLGANPTNYTVFGSTFNQNLYTQYVDDLWNYYTAANSHYIYIDAGEVAPGCILQAQVVSASQMKVEPRTGNSNCPATDSTGGSNTWYWDKFTAADFVGGAASNPPSTLYGVNKSYQSMGKYVSAAQNVGFLPYCSNPDIVYGPNIFSDPAYQSLYWSNPTGQYNCLGNSGSYGNSIMNQYDKVFHQYIPLNYAWAYDDVLGISSAITTDATKFGFTMDIHKFK